MFFIGRILFGPKYVSQREILTHKESNIKLNKGRSGDRTGELEITISFKLSGKNAIQVSH